MKLKFLLISGITCMATRLPESIRGNHGKEISQPLMARSPSEQYHFTRCLNGDESDLAFIRAVEEGIAYLTQPSKKDATISLPSDTCTRVSCSWNSQIQFCNQGSLHNQTTMGDIGRSAKEILDKCRSPYPGAREDFVQGVTWDIGDTWDTQTYVGFDHC